MYHVHVSVKRNQDQRETRTERDIEKGRERAKEREREKEKMYPSNQLDPGSCPFLVSTIRSFVVLLIDLSCEVLIYYVSQFSVFFFFPIQSLRNFFLNTRYVRPTIRILPGSRETLEKNTCHVTKFL